MARQEDRYILHDEYTDDVLNNIQKQCGINDNIKLGSIIVPNRKHKHVSIDEMYH